MPQVGRKKFGYNPPGRLAARREARRTGRPIRESGGSRGQNTAFRPGPDMLPQGPQNVGRRSPLRPRPRPRPNPTSIYRRRRPRPDIWTGTIGPGEHLTSQPYDIRGPHSGNPLSPYGQGIQPDPHGYSPKPGGPITPVGGRKRGSGGSRRMSTPGMGRVLKGRNRR